MSKYAGLAALLMAASLLTGVGVVYGLVWLIKRRVSVHGA